MKGNIFPFAFLQLSVFNGIISGQNGLPPQQPNIIRIIPGPIMNNGDPPPLFDGIIPGPNGAPPPLFHGNIPGPIMNNGAPSPLFDGIIPGPIMNNGAPSPLFDGIIPGPIMNNGISTDPLRIQQGISSENENYDVKRNRKGDQRLPDGDVTSFYEKCNEKYCWPTLTSISDEQQTYWVPTDRLWELCGIIPPELKAHRVKGCNNLPCKYKEWKFINSAGNLETSYIQEQYKELPNSAKRIQKCASVNTTGNGYFDWIFENIFELNEPRKLKRSANPQQPMDGNNNYYHVDNNEEVGCAKGESYNNFIETVARAICVELEMNLALKECALKIGIMQKQ